MVKKLNKCDELGFEHAWKDITPNIVYPTFPPKHPNPKRQCMNCGRIEELITKQQEIKEWVELKING